MTKLDEPVKLGLFVKLMICLNIVAIVFCFRVCNVRITQDEETQEYIQHLENRVETQRKLLDYYEEVRR